MTTRPFTRLRVLRGAPLLLTLAGTLGLACGTSTGSTLPRAAPVATSVDATTTGAGSGAEVLPPMSEEAWPADLTIAPHDVAAPPAEATVTASGLAYRVLRPGAGQVHPTASSEVTVHYAGWTTDGALFDSSLRRGMSTTFRLDTVIPGWTEGVQRMVQGERTRFWVPEALAYEGRHAPFGMLVFDIELLAIAP